MYRQFRWMIGLSGLLVLRMAILTVTSATPSKDKENNSEVYRYSAGDVFEASQAVLENMRMSVEQADKDAGKITGTGKYVQNGAYVKLAFDVRIESISPKPETRVTVEAKPKGFNLGLGGGYAKAFRQEFLVNLQKTLAVRRRSEIAKYQELLCCCSTKVGPRRVLFCSPL